MSANLNVDRNLLFAVIALQDDLIDQAQFADVCAGWAVRLGRPLADLLVERKWITEQDRSDIERKLERKLAKHKGDMRATLGAVAEIEARDVLEAIPNPELRQSLNGLHPARGHVLVETLVPPTSERDSLRYTLTRLHAEGGLGKVWIAHDTDLNRDVALKEIKTSTSPSPESWRRFLKEAQITGQLEHPNIVPVYELARRKQDDQPFYTMRFLKGQTLRDAIAEFHRRRAGKPADRLELQRQLLEPFVKVCQAVGYAHSRGVIHRDLKPENVVLGGHGEVVVLDWGLAKVIGQNDPEQDAPSEPSISVSADAETLRTHGQVGTPPYMAPEQVDARVELINTQTDVYGLGAILFEILTAVPPAGGTTIGEVFSRIRAGNIPKAREVESTVPRALEAICSRALAHEQRNRYLRAEDLAEDVRRWLLDTPVSVYRDPMSVRFLRWARHHRTLATSLTVLLTTAVVGLSLGLFLIDRERARTEQQRVIAESERAAARSAEAQALLNLRLAQGAADGLLGEVADVELADVPQMESVRRRLLEKASAGYQQFVAQRGDDPLVRWGAARASVRLGDIQALLGDAPKAEPLYQQAISALEALSKQDPANDDYRRDLARGEHGHGVMLKDASQFQQGEIALRNAIQLREVLAKGVNSTPEDRKALAESRYNLGALLVRRGNIGPENMASYQAAIEGLRELMGKTDDWPTHRSRLTRYENNMAILQNASGHGSDAEKTLRSILEKLEPSLTGPTALPAIRWQYARASNNLGALLLSNRLDEAAKNLHTADDLLRTLTAEFPEVPQYASELASVKFNLGLLAKAKRQPADALSAYQDAAKLLESLNDRFPGTPIYRMKLAVADLQIGADLARASWPDAEAAIQKALGQQSALLAEHPNVPEYQRELGRGHYQFARLLIDRKPADAVREAEAARTLQRQVLEAFPSSESDQGYLASTQGVLSLALMAAGQLADAAAAAEQMPIIRPAEPAAYIHSAALLIRCAAAVPNTQDAQRLAEEYSMRAVAALRSAVQSKVIRAKATLDAPDLAPLRSRADFKNLQDSLTTSAQAG